MIAFPPKRWNKTRLNFQQFLMTAEQQRKIPALYSQDGKGFAATVYIKFFAGGLTWLATEFDPAEGLFFGFTINHHNPDYSEFGYFSAAEICSRPYPETRRNSAGRLTIIPAIERDLHFTPCTLEEACKQNGFTPRISPPAVPAAVSDDGTLEPPAVVDAPAADDTDLEPAAEIDTVTEPEPILPPAPAPRKSRRKLAAVAAPVAAAADPWEAANY